ncbi:FMN reductase (NADH) NtaB [Mesorhizobium plurifarium]|uniref:FMN reductase (NADH) NtaB n=1 Tax=Mesorhizobium plurifarium TaxID=69974 RepID=A0A0K2VR16_MESPL|nr:FMN reductase (NADH) NtaB [Mesorhizobium plurifarium]
MQTNATRDSLFIENTARQPTEVGDPATDSRLFRRCLGLYGTGIAIITTETQDQRAAVTVNSFASVSLDPPLVLWSISRASRSYPLFKNGSHFAVNILASTQMDVSRHFSSKVDDKFADSAWWRGEFGSPLLDGCLAHFECETYSQVEGGDHTILIGLVRRASRFEGEPLLFAQGQYSVAYSHPEVPPSPEVGGVMPRTSSAGAIIPQIFEAHHLLSSTFDEHRHAEGLDISVARVIACIYDMPGLKADQVARATYLGQRDTEDALATLVERGMLVSSADGQLILTEAGRLRREAIRKRWEDFQKDQLASISEGDRRATLRTLSKLIEQNRMPER